MITKFLQFQFGSSFPKFISLSQMKEQPKKGLVVLHSEETQHYVKESQRSQFKENNRVTYEHEGIKKTFVSEKGAKKGVKISKDTTVQFSQKIQGLTNFRGIASNILTSAFTFSRKQQQKAGPSIYYHDFKQQNYVVELSQARIRSQQLANMRADEANTGKFQEQALRIANQLPVKLTMIKGDQLLKAGFRLMHAVGRASENEPLFVNLSYNGNPQSDEWHSFVGKGVCFDTGGLNLKPTSGIKDMHMDKHGATSVMSAFQSVVRLKLKVNLTVSLGFVENSISNNAYRPLDIIKSRKGIAVEIGNTDAQGRLVLADCMNWTQQNYKVKDLIQLSTLTGAVVVALGKKHAGLFSNSDDIAVTLNTAGTEVNEEMWRLPVDEYHHEIIKTKHADITNSPGKIDAASSQAAAFLQRFVEKDVKWVHLDIAGTSKNQEGATGYGARLLVNYLKNMC